MSPAVGVVLMVLMTLGLAVLLYLMISFAWT
jgi:hypothetical protein